MTTSMNERIHFFMKIYISHFILERVDVSCVCEVSGNKDRLLYWPQVLLTIAALLSHLGWGCSTMGHWGPKALCLSLALTSASCPQLNRTALGTWLYYCLTTTCFRCSPLISTGASLDWRLGRGSIYNKSIELFFDFRRAMVFSYLLSKLKNKMSLAGKMKTPVTN